MGPPSAVHLLSILLLLLGTTRCTHHHKEAAAGDFVFDSTSIEDTLNHEQDEKNCPLKRLWGVPDMPAYVGRIFQLRIPKEAFTGKVQSYKITNADGVLPGWLLLDSQRGLLRGIPGPEDRGEHRLEVTATPEHHSTGRCRYATDVFTIEVKDKRDSPIVVSNGEHQCRLGEDDTRLNIIIDKPYKSITSKQRLNAVMHIANFMLLEFDAFSIHSNEVSNDKEHDIVLLSGHPGGKKKHNKMDSSIIELTVGCNGEFWPKHSILVHQIKQQVLDGTLTEIINLPVVGWKVLKHKQAPLLRKQRQIMDMEGSAIEDEEAEDDEDISTYDMYEEYDDANTDTVMSPHVPTAPPPPPPTIPPTPPHHHRHHHGETATTPKNNKDITIIEKTYELPTFTPDIDLEPLTPNIINTDDEDEEDFDEEFVEEPTLPTTSTVQTVVTEMTSPIHTNPPVVSYAPSSPSTEPVENPIQENEIIPTDTITTLAGTPQMETEGSSTAKEREEDNTGITESDDYDIAAPHGTYTTHTVSWTHSTSTTTSTTPIEDTTLYMTIDYTQNVAPNKTIQIVPQETNKTDSVDTFDKKDIIPKYSSPDIVPIFEPTEQSKMPIDEHSVPMVPEYTTHSGSRSSLTPRINYPLKEDKEDEDEEPVTIPYHRVTDFIPSISTGYFDRDTTPQDITTTEKTSTIIGRTTETVEFPTPANNPPKMVHRTKKVVVTAGKYFSYIIPEDLFIDDEDGMNLKLAMYDIEHTPLKASSWVQFDPKTREVYGLPLEEHVSKWEYLVEATDSSGLSVTDTLEIKVQQHKGKRTVNHEFSMKLRVQKKYPAVIDWQIRALKGLVSLFRDTDMDQITVIEVDLESDPMQFVWTNDTLPRNSCPKSDIDRLMGVLQSTPDGDPSPGLESSMSPELLIKSVAWKSTGACRAPPTQPPPQPPHHPDNFGPMPRNQIDHINATAGKLLIYKVPEDTFYDPEDGSARNLKMWLTKGDRNPLSPHNWLQFDAKNQEFYGLPMERDIGRKEYQLVCEDSGGLMANDGLLVEVHAAPAFRPTVEFQMTVDNPTLENAAKKRKFIEKIQQLFGDSDASHIKIKSITYRPTVVSWYNTSLPGDRCPKEEINQLRDILVGSDGAVNPQTDDIMGVEFPVVSVALVNKGVCGVVGGGVPARGGDTPTLLGPSEDAAKPVNADNYLITFIVPIVVIVCMIIIASLIACILYKRRRTGKMDVGDDEEKQAFRPKIPVIFQDELDEKPDPSNKSPVIMKEEKPPLLPPPEYKGMDSSSPTPSHTPYHPPPPFTANRDTPRNNRPKPSPAYRKPPPYVPP